MLGLGAKINRSVKGRRGFTSNVAMNFDGSADYVKILDHADFNHDTGSYSKFTISFWFKTDDTDFSGEAKALLSKYDVGENKREWNVRIHTDGVIYVYISDNGTNALANVTSYTVSDTNWHHFIMRYDGSQSATDRCLAYVDGAIVLNSSTGTANSGNTAQLNEDDADVTIGVWQNSGASANEFDGKIDEVAYWKGAMALGGSNKGFADYVYNNGNPRDLSYSDRNNTLIGYWRMGEYGTAGCPVPSGTFPNTSTNPHDSSKYRGSTAPTMIALNWAGGKPRKVGDNLITNGNFVDGGPALADDEETATVNGWISYTSSAGATVTTDTSIYRSEGKSAKITTDADGTFLRIARNTNASLEDGECYVLEYWLYSPTDVSDAGGQEWSRSQLELDECIEGDAQYGLSGGGGIVSSYIKINQWTRHILVGKYNKGSDAAELCQLVRQFGNLDAGEGPAIYYYDDISVYKLSGSHHGLVQSPGALILDEGVG